jgi:hypothetical protein
MMQIAPIDGVVFSLWQAATNIRCFDVVTFMVCTMAILVRMAVSISEQFQIC